MSFHIKELEEKSKLQLEHIYETMDAYFDERLLANAANIIEDRSVVFIFISSLVSNGFHLNSKNSEKVFNYIKIEYEKRGWLVCSDNPKEPHRYIKFAIPKEYK